MKSTNTCQVPGHRRKEALLPLITALALEGHASRAISVKAKVNKSTVNRWLNELRQKWIAESQANIVELTTIAYARYELLYREAMNAWRLSQKGKKVQSVDDGGRTDDKGAAKKKRTRRTESQAGNAVFLAKAIEAVKAICRLKGLDAPRRTELTGPAGRPIELTAVTPDDLRLMSDEQLAALEARLLARDQPQAEGNGRP